MSQQDIKNKNIKENEPFILLRKQGSLEEEKIIMKKKIATILTAAVIGATAFTTIVSAASGDITVVSREDGSGTRGAFVELF